MKKFVLILICILSAKALAATITWGSATTISSTSDISTNGTLLYAVNFTKADAAVVSPTVNGVTFTGQTATAGTNVNINIGTTNSGAFGTGGTGTGYGDLDSSYQNLIKGAIWRNGAQTYTLNGLTSGVTYEVQIWSNDSRAATGKSASIDSGAVTLDLNNTDALGGLGQWVIGSFVASGTTQAFAHLPTTGTGINALQVRSLAVVPEPSSLALLALSMTSLCFMRRRK